MESLPRGPHVLSGAGQADLSRRLHKPYSAFHGRVVRVRLANAREHRRVAGNRSGLSLVQKD